ncbi:MAG: deoxycytidylate deaminase [Pseudobdellovibrionaceae bacterium]
MTDTPQALTPYDAMQMAVDIVNSSPHPTNKVAATLVTHDSVISATNYWPEEILQTLGTEARIGGASGTIHAETAVILRTPKSKGGAIYITDPFCPNCAKNVIEAGIATVYIDHKGFEKDFWERRSGDFANMSMALIARAGLSVYEVNRKAATLTPIYEPKAGYIPVEDAPVTITPLDNDAGNFASELSEICATQYNRKIAFARGVDAHGKGWSLCARAHAVTGFTMKDDQDVDRILQAPAKYSFIQEPLNRLLMVARREGLALDPDTLYCSQIPTAREQVNFIGAGFDTLKVGRTDFSRDESGLAARDLVEAHHLLHFEKISL